MVARKRKKAKEAEAVDSGFKPFWGGTISFGLVSVPVNLFPANRRGGVPLRMLDEDGTPVARRFYCPEHGRDVHPEHLVRGYELDDGKYIVVRDDELEELEPTKSQEIDLQRVVDINQISPMLFERTYYLTPSGTSSKAYRLLAEVMERTGRAGIATFVMRDKEYLVAILAKNGILQAQTMRFQDEIRSPEDVGLPEVPSVPRQKVTQFERAIKSHFAEKLSLEELKDEQSEKLRKLIESKHKAHKDVVEVVEEEPTEDAEGTPEADLLETIRQSLHSGARSHARNGRHSTQTERKSKTNRGYLAREASESKASLYDRAAKRGIEGRSHMTKQQLERALRKG